MQGLGKAAIRIGTLVLLLFGVACGSVSTTNPDGGAGGKGGGGTSGAAGQSGASGTAGTGGSGGSGRGGRGGSDGRGGAGGDSGSGGAGGTVDAGCLSTNALGFAWNVSNPCPRDGGPACYAACQLNGAQYVGCVSGSTIGTECYRSCSDCP